MVWEWEWTKYRSACHTLGLEYEHTIFDIKAQYRAKALASHPDKCSEEGAAARFQEVQAAYEFLKRHKETSGLRVEVEDEDVDGEGAGVWVAGACGANNIPKIACMIMRKMAKICEKRTRELLEGLELGLLERLVGVLELYPATIQEVIREIIHEIMEARRGQTECIIINPLLDDVMADNLYPFVRDGKTYIVPLWHHELVYDVESEAVSGCFGGTSEMVIQVIPILPENVSVDGDNNVHVSLTYKLLDIWLGAGCGVDFWLGGRRFVIPRNQICMTEKQTVVLCGQGISRVCHTDIYDVRQRGDVVVHLCIYCE